MHEAAVSWSKIYQLYEVKYRQKAKHGGEFATEYTVYVAKAPPLKLTS